MKSKRLLDLLISFLLIFIAAYLTYTFQPNFLLSTLLFFGLPSIYLLYKKPSLFKKSLLAGLIIGVIWGFAFDFIAEFNHAWGWSSNTKLSFPLNVFGVVSIDILIWYFLWVFLMVTFYEYFADDGKSKKISKNALPATGIGIFVSILLVFVSKVAPVLITFQFAYLILGILTLVPFIVIILKRPIIFPKVMEIIPFFIVLFLIFEITALRTSLWSFPGSYIGSVVFNNISFPFEEMIFWICISSAVAASYHELIVDDYK